jgi:hypothetical protein
MPIRSSTVVVLIVGFMAHSTPWRLVLQEKEHSSIATAITTVPDQRPCPRIASAKARDTPGAPN